jgi:hypothetical protein
LSLSIGGFNSKLVSLWHRSIFSVCPIHFHFHSFICTATGFPCAHFHISSSQITLGQKILQVFLRHLFINLCKALVILFVTLYPYRRTDLILLLEILSFVSVDITLDKVE